MRVDDMIILSIDDHTVEPPDLFDEPPAREATRTGRLGSSATTQGKEHWEFEGRSSAIFGLNATVSWPKEEWGLNPSALAEMRPGGLPGRRAGPRHGPQRRAWRRCASRACPGSAAAGSRRPTTRSWRLVMLQAYNDWHIDEWCASHPGRFMPLVDRADLGHGRHGRRGQAGRGQGLPGHLHARAAPRPGTADLPERLLGPLLPRGLRRGHGRCACTSAWGSTPSTWALTSHHGQLHGAVDAGDGPLPCRTCCGVRRCASTPTSRWPSPRAASDGSPSCMDRVDRHYLNQRWTGQDFGGKLPSEVFREHCLGLLHLRPDVAEALPTTSGSTSSPSRPTTPTRTRCGPTPPKSCSTSATAPA